MLFFIFMMAPPTDAAAKLIQEYLAIRTDQPANGTEEAAKFWMREAKFLGLQAATWSLDPKGKCTHFVTVLPATISNPGLPLLLLHHGDTVPATDREWTYPPFKPQWVQGAYDWEIYGRGAIDDKGHGIVHWMAIRAMSEQPRNRDLYFVMNCGEEVGDPSGARGFVHYFLKPIDSNRPELSTLERLELASVLRKFPTLPKVEWIWNEGSFGERTQIAPYTLVPIATSQKGYWLGEVKVVGASGHGSLSTKMSPLEVVVGGSQRLYERNRSLSERFRSLHTEMESLVSAVGSTRPLWQRVLLWIYPRLFFEIAGLQSMVTSWWVPSGIQTNSSLPNVIASEASVNIEYRFLGEKNVVEIESQIREAFRDAEKNRMDLKILTKDFIPFRRDFFEGSEAKIFNRVLSSYPKTLVTPFITPGITDSRFFRMAGVRAFDFVPFFLSQEEVKTMHGKDERLPYLELKRGIEIEKKILEQMLQ